jgi:hypothetical protein
MLSKTWVVITVLHSFYWSPFVFYFVCNKSKAKFMYNSKHTERYRKWLLFHTHKTRLHCSPMDVWLLTNSGTMAFSRCKPPLWSTAISTATICYSFSVSQQTSCNLWNLEVRYHAHKIQLLVTILSQMTAVRNLPSDIFKIHFNVIILSIPRSSELPLSFRFSNHNPVFIFSLCTCHVLVSITFTLIWSLWSTSEAKTVFWQ